MLRHGRHVYKCIYDVSTEWLVNLPCTNGIHLGSLDGLGSYHAMHVCVQGLLSRCGLSHLARLTSVGFTFRSIIT